MGKPALLAVGLLAFAAAGCATKADVQTLESSLVEEMSQIRDDQVQLVRQMHEAIDSLNAAEARRASLGQGELDRRVGRLESALAGLMDVAVQNNQLLNDILTEARRSPGTFGSGPTGGATGRTPADAAMDPTTRMPQGSDDATQFYAMALEQFRLGNLETARGALEEFMAMNPDHQLAPDAQYHIARTYEDGGDVAQALTAYQRVTELYPDSNRAPTALWRRGLIEVSRGNTAIARRLFTQIQSGYPNSPELPLAQQELAKLGG
ncbi:MAG: tetratricopeptide repeat protein [Gemmatimonadota bacterium]|nr:tetratricopeptide repeat protein [Gemmatimonadota bacterium]